MELLTDTRFTLKQYLIMISFMLFSLLGILSHEMWRDELQAWMLARDSSSLLGLYQNMQFEGHPMLWHVLLFGLSHLSHNPLVMQIFHWLISSAIIFLILKYSNFTIIQKLSLSFSYFIFYEYTFISRSYSLAILFACFFCVFTSRDKKPYLLIFITLALMANTSAYGFLLSVTLACFLLLHESRVLYVFNLEKIKLLSASILSGIGILSFSWAVSFWQMARAKSAEILEKLLILSVSGHAYSHTVGTLPVALPLVEEPNVSFGLLEHFQTSLSSIWDSYIPVPNFVVSFWNSNILEPDLLCDYGISFSCFFDVKIFLSLLFLLTFSLLFWRQKSITFTYLFGSSLLILFHTFVFKNPYARHQGFFFILLIVMTWLYQIVSDNQDQDNVRSIYSQRERTLSFFLSFILLIQMVSGVYAGAVDYIYPFSAGKAAAMVIKDKNISDLSILGSRYRQVGVISGYLDTPIYYLERRELGTFWLANAPEFTDQKQLIQSVNEFLQTSQDRKHILVLNQSLTSTKAANFDINCIAKFENTIVGDERFYVYSLS